MPDDDLSQLTPTDPAAVDPDWNDKRQDILDGILAAKAPRRSGGWRWVAGVAAAALVVVAVGGITHQLRREPWATPASPTPTTGAERTELVAAQSRVIFAGAGAILCRASLIPSPHPPGCDGIPIEGLSPEEVPWIQQAGGTEWADVIVTGTFDGTTLTAADVYEDDDPKAPRPVPWRANDDLKPLRDLCNDPTAGHGSGEQTLWDTEVALPGYQGSWGKNPHNVAVTGDVEAARKALAEHVEGDFCVAVTPGMSAVDGRMAEVAASAVHGVEWANYTSDARGAWLLVMLLTDDKDVKAEVLASLSPAVRPFTAITSFFYPVQRSSSPDPTGSTSPRDPSTLHDGPVALEGTLLEVDGVMGLCYGQLVVDRHVPTSMEPQVCGGGFVPVSGLAMPASNQRYGILVGTFDGTTFHATRLYGPGEENRPRSPLYTMPPEPPDVCEERTGTGTADENDVMAAAEALPGFQGMWLTSDMSASHYRIAVTHGAQEAQKTLLDRFGVLLCVATVPGPDDATLRTAERAVNALWQRKPGQLEPFVQTDVWAEAIGMSLRVTVLDDTDEIRSRVREAVGPEVWPSTKVIPLLFPVDAAALEPRVDTPTPMPPGPATPLVITATDRQRAEQSVASDLKDAVGTSATAMMAKATFAQYEALWTIDVPYPPGPPAADTVVLVVTLSAPLDNRVMHGGPLSGEPRKATGSINVIDAETGKSIIYATLLGDGPTAELITHLPGPIEDVNLPAGFR